MHAFEAVHILKWYFYFSSKRLFLLACYFVVLLGEN